MNKGRDIAEKNSAAKDGETKRKNIRPKDAEESSVKIIKLDQARPPKRQVQDFNASEKSSKVEKTRRELVVFSLALFSFAAILILISYLYTVRISESNIAQAKDSNQLSLTALQTVDSIRQENAQLKNELDELKRVKEDLSDNVARSSEEIEALKSENDELNKSLDQALAENQSLKQLTDRLTGELAAYTEKDVG
jgi:regulator of replication initiation timing